MKKKDRIIDLSALMETIHVAIVELFPNFGKNGLMEIYIYQGKCEKFWANKK